MKKSIRSASPYRKNQQHNGVVTGQIFTEIIIYCKKLEVMLTSRFFFCSSIEKTVSYDKLMFFLTLSEHIMLYVIKTCRKILKTVSVKM